MGIITFDKYLSFLAACLHRYMTFCRLLKVPHVVDLPVLSFCHPGVSDISFFALQVMGTSLQQLMIPLAGIGWQVLSPCLPCAVYCGSRRFLGRLPSTSSSFSPETLDLLARYSASTRSRVFRCICVACLGEETCLRERIHFSQQVCPLFSHSSTSTSSIDDVVVLGFLTHHSNMSI